VRIQIRHGWCWCWCSFFFLHHALDQLVDELLTVAPVTTTGFVETVTLGGEATLRGAELEGGQEVVALLELVTDGVELVDEVLDAGDAVLAEGLVDLAVVIKRDALLVDAAESALVDQVADGGDGRVTVGDVGLDETQHVQSALVDLDEDTVVHLTETQELHDLLRLRRDLVHTGEADGENDLLFRLDEEIALLMSLTAKIDETALLTLVLLLVLGEVGHGDLAETLVLFLDLDDRGLLLLEELGIAGSLLGLAFGQDLSLAGERGIDAETISHCDKLNDRRRAVDYEMVINGVCYHQKMYQQHRNRKLMVVCKRC